MSGPAPKPRDQRARRNRNEGTTSETVVLADQAEIPAWAGELVEHKLNGEVVHVPKPPNGGKLLKVALDAWALWWIGPEANMLRPQQMPALRRLVLLYDEEERLRRAIATDREVVLGEPWGADGPAGVGEYVVATMPRLMKLPGRLGVGSTGQIVSAPEVAQLKAVRAEIRALEDRFAGSPMAQFKVGWQQAEMFRSQAGAAREAQAIAAAAAAIGERHEAMLEQGP